MAKVKVKYFGRLRELLGVKEEEYEVGETTLADLLLKHIPERHGEVAEEWKQSVFMTIRGEVAVNRDGTPILRNYYVLVGGKSPEITYRLKDGDEVAILPPVGGG
ncbi:MAG: MoaD/ThiS family protein [Candidatus Bathyarchaeia archaeon]|nr:MoaD/ThiS family protein [Candidatus Bathyarchaeota archaeon]